VNTVFVILVVGTVVTLWVAIIRRRMRPASDEELRGHFPGYRRRRRRRRLSQAD
jgi:hypothetical protein